MRNSFDSFVSTVFPFLKPAQGGQGLQPVGQLLYFSHPHGRRGWPILPSMFSSFWMDQPFFYFPAGHRPLHCDNKDFNTGLK
jgi:hypothetical protein